MCVYLYVYVYIYIRVHIYAICMELITPFFRIYVSVQVYITCEEQPCERPIISIYQNFKKDWAKKASELVMNNIIRKMKY